MIRSKEQLVAVRPIGDALGMATMIFADEVLPPERLDEIAEVKEVTTTARELDVATQLIDSLAGDFEPDRFRDTYREQVLELIERKAAGKAIAVQPEPEEAAAPAPDLMTALKASLDAVRAARRRTPTRAAKRHDAQVPKPAAAKKGAAKRPRKRRPAKLQRPNEDRRRESAHPPR